MVLPIDLVLVRHGESEGNLAHMLSRNGDHSPYENPDFVNRHSSLWRLSETGHQQAKVAGEWIKNNIGSIDAFFTSEYVRAMETAALLDLPNACWRTEFYLRERDWGVLDPLSYDQQREQFGPDLERKERNSFYWQPPCGESLAGVCLRVDRVMEGLHKDCSDKRVIVVCHGEVMWAFRVRLERISQRRYTQMDQSNSKYDRIHQCQIMHYTRRDPKTGQLHPTMNWVRSVCPWDMSLSTNEWQEIKRGYYSNEALMKKVEQYPPIMYRMPSAPKRKLEEATITEEKEGKEKEKEKEAEHSSSKAHKRRKVDEEEKEDEEEEKEEKTKTKEEEEEERRKRKEEIKQKRAAALFGITSVSFDRFHNFHHN